MELQILSLLNDGGANKIKDYIDFCNLVDIPVNAKEKQKILDENTFCFVCNQKIEDKTNRIPLPYKNGKKNYLILTCLDCAKELIDS